MSTSAKSGLVGNNLVRIYLDTAPIVYAVEQVIPYAGAVERRITAPGVVLVASDLSRMECRVKPLRQRDSALLANYDRFFHELIMDTVTLSREVIDRATDIRAHYGFRTPDAIHLAAAVLGDCTLFLTNDRRLQRFNDLAVEPVLLDNGQNA